VSTLGALSLRTVKTALNGVGCARSRAHWHVKQVAPGKICFWTGHVLSRSSVGRLDASGHRGAGGICLLLRRTRHGGQTSLLSVCV
jgi:hypothetical protein